MLIADDIFDPLVTQRVIVDLDDKGIATVPSLIDAETLREDTWAADVAAIYRLAYAGPQRKPLREPDFAEVPDHIVNKIWASKAIHGLAREILRSCGASEEFGTHFIINALDNRTAIADYGVGHFDASYLTLLLPLQVAKPPHVGDAGKLRVWPNARKFTQSRMLDSLGCRLFNVRPFRDLRPNVSLDLVPGCLYAFYGFRSYHQIVPMVQGMQRVTVAMHFGGPRFDRMNGVKRDYVQTRRFPKTGCT